MTAAVEARPHPTTPERTADRRSIGDLLRQLGDIPPDRVRLHPQPGTVTFEQFVAIHENRGPVCEWVDGTLVEKAVGLYESWLGAILSGKIDQYLLKHDIGMLVGEAGVMRILPDIGRAADVAFLAWSNLPGDRPPPRSDPIPAVVPDLAVEVLSVSNTRAEMARKRGEYLRAGVKLVWEIDPETRSATEYTALDKWTVIPPDEHLDGGQVLPGFRVSLADLFARADRIGRGAS